MAKSILNRLSYPKMLEQILRRPRVVVLVTVLISIFFAFQIPQLKFTTSIYDLVIEDLPENQSYMEFKKVFGSDEIIRLVVRTGGLFDPATFLKITELSEAAGAIPGVRRVISLPEIRKAIDIGGKMTLEQFVNTIAPAELFHRNLFSEDRKSTIITLVLDKSADPEAVISGVDRIIGHAGSDLALYQIGMPLVSQALARSTQTDFFRLPPITFVLIGIVLLIFFRSFRFFVLPLITVSLALLWTLGMMAISAIPLSMLIMVVPVFLLAVGTAYCLHIVNACMSFSDEISDTGEILSRAFTSISFPTLLAVITTITGLGSLLLNRIPAIREFAIFFLFRHDQPFDFDAGLFPGSVAALAGIE